MTSIEQTIDDTSSYIANFQGLPANRDLKANDKITGTGLYWLIFVKFLFDLVCWKYQDGCKKSYFAQYCLLSTLEKVNVQQEIENYMGHFSFTKLTNLNLAASLIKLCLLWLYVYDVSFVRLRFWENYLTNCLTNRKLRRKISWTYCSWKRKCFPMFDNDPYYFLIFKIFLLDGFFTLILWVARYGEPIFVQHHISMPPENHRFSDVFKGYRNVTLD